ncbi:MAG: hypothetical protein GQ552_01910, partial [Flavobacteriaceae bacterium]|nr:hypothetical protein [Flavobacteriaceae bacterium]
MLFVDIPFPLKGIFVEKYMIKKFLYIITTFLAFQSSFAQVKVSGIVVDEQNEPVPFSNVIFKGSTKGTITDENGHFYLQSDAIFKELEVSFVGFENEVVPLKRNNFDLKIILKESRDQLKEVKLYSGRIKKKGNPAIAILKKIWNK